MAETRLETTEPDPSVNTVGKDETVNSQKPTDAEMPDSVSAETTGGAAIAIGEPPKDATTDGNATDSVSSGRNGENREQMPRSYPQKPRIDYSENIKSDLTSQEESNDPVEIRKQVSFLFMRKSYSSKTDEHQG